MSPMGAVCADCRRHFSTSWAYVGCGPFYCPSCCKAKGRPTPLELHRAADPWPDEVEDALEAFLGERE